MRSISSLALILLATATLASAQTQSPTLEERMSQSEFHAAGLDKLSPQELAQLNGWIDAHGGSNVKYVTSGGSPVFYPDSGGRETIEQHIVGTFTGWRGHTIFALDNGQEWRQAESGVRDTGKFSEPLVRIKPTLLGSWLMYVEGCGCSLRVERIK
jgi:hypothetical protein